MLVITSDLHLADRTTGTGIPTGAFELFQNRLCDMAYDASQHVDGTYQPIESFDLLLLGDILEALSSTHWTDEEKGQPGYARPWSRPYGPAFVNKLEQITDGILRENAASLEILRGIASGEGITLPPATRDLKVDRRVSRDPRSGHRLPVKVRIHYVIGNHDWYYHLPGAGFDEIRRKIVSAMGLANKFSPFPYVPSESDLVSNVLKQHSVFGRHGDWYDPYNLHKKNRDHASLSDAVCIELFNRFRVQIKSELQGKLPEGFFQDLDEMGSVRPDLMMPVWLASLLDRYRATRPQRERIDGIWHELVEQFTRLDFLDELEQPFQFDLIDGIKAALNFARLVSIDNLNDWALAIQKLQGKLGQAGKDNLFYEKYAVQEVAYKSREAHFIVFGHTHQFAVTPLRTTNKNGMPFDQVYLNAGTWRPVHEVCDGDSNKKGFVSYKTMGYVCIFKDDERRCKGFETWSGTLDI